jgi:hypothetical protein
MAEGIRPGEGARQKKCHFHLKELDDYLAQTNSISDVSADPSEIDQ